MSKRKKSFLALVLSVMMVVTFMPSTTFAGLDAETGNVEAAAVQQVEDTTTGETKASKEVAPVQEETQSTEATESTQESVATDNTEASETTDSTEAATPKQEASTEATEATVETEPILDALAEENSAPTTADLKPLLVKVVLDGIEKTDDGYEVAMNKSYGLQLYFAEKKSLQFDMDGNIFYKLPKGVKVDGSKGQVVIGVREGGSLTEIKHNYTIDNNTLTVHWNKSDANFPDLAAATNVTFQFYINVQFDGSEERIAFNDGDETTVHVDNYGALTITKSITGLGKDKETLLTPDKKSAMKFNLIRVNGDEEEVVKSFTYADMEDESITYRMAPGTYKVVETAHPEFTNYTFDVKDSITTVSDIKLGIAETKSVDLSNDYEADCGSLVLTKTVDWVKWNGDKVAIPENLKEKISFHITGPYNYDKTYKYNDKGFVDGVLTLNNLPVGEYTITEKNDIAGYIWTAKVDNKAVTSGDPTATVDVKKGEEGKTVFANTYKEVLGNLEIVKVTNGATTPDDAKFTVTFPDGTVKTFLYKDMTGGKYTFANVPLGEYKITEDRGTAAVANYTLNVTGEGKVTANEEGKTKTVTITNDYTPVGSLKITKAVTGDLTGDDLTYNQRRVIIFDVYSVTGGKESKVGSCTYQDIYTSADKCKVFSNLPLGDYVVKEKTGTVSGFSVTTSPSKDINATVEHGKQAEVAFTNNYIKNHYNLKLVKVFGKDSLYNENSNPAPDITFQIKDKSGNPIKDMDGNPVTLTYADLVAGKDTITTNQPGPYTVTEVIKKEAGISVTSKVKVVEDDKDYKAGTSTDVTLALNSTKTVQFENYYEEQGKIVGDKTVIGLYDYEETALRAKLLFTIYQIESGTVKTYRDNVTLAELEKGIVVPKGTYYVQEASTIGVDGYNGPNVSTKVDNGPVQNKDNTNNFTVDRNQTVTVHFTNEYNRGITPGTGEIGVEKYVRGLEEIGSTNEIELTTSLNVNNTKGTLLYNGIKFLIEEKRNVAGTDKYYEYGTYTLDEIKTGKVTLPEGTFRITELDGDVDGYLLHVDYVIKTQGEEPSQKTPTSIEFTVEKSKNYEIIVHDVYSRIGALEITKLIDGDVTTIPSDVQKTMKFTVEGPFNFYDEFTYYQLLNMAGKKKVYTNIPAGEYTIKETGGAYTNYNMTVKTNVSGDGTAKVNVVKGETAQVTFTNTYKHQRGSLKIVKIMAGQAPETLTDDQKKAMKFTIDGPEGKKEVTYYEFTNGEYKWENIKVGQYKVTETIGGVLVNEYKVVTKSDAANNTITVEENQTPVITITNTFNQTGNLKLVKDFEGTELSQANKESVKFTVKGANFNKTYTYKQFTNGELVIKQLLPGSYTVTEENDTTGYKRTTEVKVDGGSFEQGTGATATIAFAKTATVEFKNTYEEVSKLTVKKTIAGDLVNMTAEQKAAIKFSVKDPSNEEIANFSYAEMNNGVWTREGLTPGKYTVTESIADTDLFREYTLETANNVDANGAVATIETKHGDNNVTFTNTYKKIDELKVEKTSSHTPIGKVTIDGANYPVWRFTLNIENLNNLTTENGSTTFTDVFDKDKAEWFRLATKAEVLAVKDITAAEIDRANSAYTLIPLDGRTDVPSIKFNKDNSITISGITESTSEKCSFDYYLIVKDKNALNEFNQPTDKTKVKRNFDNVVTYHPMPWKEDTVTTDATYEYENLALAKKLMNFDPETGHLVETIDGVKYVIDRAKYSVTLNKDGATIGNKQTLTATDTFSANQTILLSTIKTNPEKGVSYVLDNEKHTLTFTIPNGTPVEVTYESTITFPLGEKSVTLKNDIELEGFMAGIEEDAKQEMGGHGEGSLNTVTILKVDSKDNSKRLEGAEFKLYDAETNEELTTVKTDGKGTVKIKKWNGNNYFEEDTVYYLVETAAPEDYILPDPTDPANRMYFMFGENRGEVTKDINGNKVKVKVLVGEEELMITNLFDGGGNIYGETDIGVKKVWNDNDNKANKRPNSVTVELYANGEPTGMTAELSEDTDWFAWFTKLDKYDENDKYIKYYIKEVAVENYSPTIVVVDDILDDGTAADNGETSDQPGFVVTNTYEEEIDIEGDTDITVNKIWEDNDDKDGKRPKSITVHLYADGEEVAVKKITAEDGWTHTFSKLPKYSDEAGEVEIVYSISEDVVYEYKTDYEVDPDDPHTFNIINTYTHETKTGDDTNLPLILALLGASLAGMGGTTLFRRKKNNA